MPKFNVKNIDLAKLAKEIKQYENQWVVISGNNKIVASGDTYGDALKNVGEREDITLFKIPSSKTLLAP